MLGSWARAELEHRLDVGVGHLPVARDLVSGDLPGPELSASQRSVAPICSATSPSEYARIMLLPPFLVRQLSTC
ncbi:MAG: hypothetical protein QOH34_2591 [Mycobacterium sp.]|nr:hypothetical protein [Mycobacterium sp.]